MTWAALEAEVSVMFRGYSAQDPYDLAFALERKRLLNNDTQRRFANVRAERRDEMRRRMGIVRNGRGWAFKRPCSCSRCR